MRDTFAAAGVVLIAFGAWWLSPPWALVSVGAILLIGGVAGQLMGNRRKVE